jgi:hypothetical protein
MRLSETSCGVQYRTVQPCWHDTISSSDAHWFHVAIILRSRRPHAEDSGSAICFWWLRFCYTDLLATNAYSTYIIALQPHK